MLVECGFVRITGSNGAEWTFTPSFSRIAGLGSPHEIVALFAALHQVDRRVVESSEAVAALGVLPTIHEAPSADANEAAAYVLAGLCDQEDPTPLIGWLDETGQHPGAMPPAEQIIIARHLMQHGICGKARPDQAAGEGGKFSDRFDAAEYVSAARVHLGLSSADAEALSMTEFQAMLAMKFPQAGEKRRDVPTREEYEAVMASIKGRHGG